MLTREPVTLSEAMEVLSGIVDLEGWETLLDLYSGEGGEPPAELALPWLQGLDEPAQALGLVRRIFRIVLDHLHYLDRSAVREEERIKIFEGIKGMMLTVGEAATRLDRLLSLVYGLPEKSITSLREYQELERFYRAKVVTAPTEEEEGPITQLRVLEQLWRDRDYELFYLLHENGSSFVSPKLRDEIKLATDFGLLSESYVTDDPLVRVREWHDKRQQETAKQLLHMTRGLRTRFYHQALLEREHPLVQLLHQALMALVLAADPKNLLSTGPYKPCYEYFDDFVSSLDQALKTDEYQHLAIERPNEELPAFLLHLIEGLCKALYTHMAADRALYGEINDLLRVGKRRTDGMTYADHIRNDFDALCRALSLHPHGPLFKAIDFLQEGVRPKFDPLMLENIPAKLCDLKVGHQAVELLRIPSPTIQTYIHEAGVSEEYKAFLRASDAKHLLVNLQDRLSWKEGARAEALEHAASHGEFVNQLVVISLAKEGDFYHQRGAYARATNAEQFLAHFHEQLESAHHGYHFPPIARGKLFPHYTHQLMETLHRLFFQGKSRLTRQERLDFIELGHLFIVAHLIESLGIHYVSMTCKDAVDTGMADSVALFAAVKILSESKYSDQIARQVWSMLFVPALLLRERAPSGPRIRRLTTLLRRLEETVARLVSEGKRQFLHEQLLF